VRVEQIRGQDLEQRIAAFLRAHGYEVSTNVVLEGRSGARHELDVVGDKSDGLTSFRLVVECKAWASPIDKGVVYKLASELADLGVAKGVIASLSGWTVQAAKVASQANVELWGPDELATRLGQASLSEMQVGHTEQLAVGFPFVVHDEVGRRQVERLAKGTLGFGREEIAWFGPLWLPVWSLQLGITRIEGHLRRVPRVTRVWNGYDALTGRSTYTSPTSPPLVSVDVSCGHVRPVLKPSKVADVITEACVRWRQVTSDAAKARHAATLSKMGVRVPVHGIAVEKTTMSYLPLWAAFLYRGAKERIVAIDGTTGKERAGLGHALTTNAQRVREALEATS